MESQIEDKNPFRTFLVCIFGGASIFILLFAAFHLMILMYAPTTLDFSALYFYPIMAGLGMVFGFERWWSYEQGSYNPFHDDHQYS